MATAALPCAGQSIAVTLGIVVVVVVVVEVVLVVVDVGTVVVVDVVVVVTTGTVVVVVEVVLVVVVGGLACEHRLGMVVVVDESAGLSWADVEEAVATMTATLIPSESREPRRIQWDLRRVTTKIYNVPMAPYVQVISANALVTVRTENQCLVWVR